MVDEPPPPNPRLLLVIRLLSGRTGGAERVYCTLANALARRGYQVTAVYCEGKSEPPAYSLLPAVHLVNLWNQREREQPWHVRFKRWGERRLPFGINHLFAWLARYLRFTLNLRGFVRREKPALVVSFLPSANTVALLSCLGTSVGVLCTNHNVPAEDYESRKRWDQNPLDRYLRRKLLGRASAISVLFPSYAGYFGKALAPKVVAIPNFLEEQFFERVPNLERKRRIVASGRLSWEKNYEALIEAFALLERHQRGYDLVIYGEGPERKSLEVLIAHHGLGNRVHLPGYEPDIRSRLREASIFCHPARFEGFALSVAEALSQGLPVVAYRDCAGVNEYVVDGQNGVLVERTQDRMSLAAGLRRLIEDDALRTRLSHDAPASVAQFRSEVVLTKWQQIVDKLVAS